MRGACLRLAKNCLCSGGHVFVFLCVLMEMLCYSQCYSGLNMLLYIVWHTAPSCLSEAAPGGSLPVVSRHRPIKGREDGAEREGDWMGVLSL